MKKYSKKDEKLITKTFLELKDITATAKSYALHKDIKYTDSTRRGISTLLKRLGVTGWTNKLEGTKEFQEAKIKKTHKKSTRFLITYAQNQTAVDNNMLKSMQTYAEAIDAEILVIAGRYENPTSFSNPDKVKDKEHWAKEVTPYLTANRHDIAKYVSILGNIKTQPTATYPLSGLQGIAGERTAIVGHPKMHLQSLPVLEGRPSQILLTTGAITYPNYSDTSAGAKGDSKHKMGFVVLELDNNDQFYVRQVEVMPNGSFMDLVYHVDGDEFSNIDSCSAYIMGDTHTRFLDKEVHHVRMNKLVAKLTPELFVQHDVMDSDSISHHSRKDPFLMFEKLQKGDNLIRREIDETLEFLHTLEDYKVVVVRSNHCDFTDRYLRDVDWKKDLPNALEYLEFSKVRLEGKAPNGILPYLIEKEFGDKINCLGRDESLIHNGFELAHHGDIGVSGSRGSLRQFAKMSTPCVIGHSHTPARIDDAFQVGVATVLRLGYNQGASSWLNSDVILHKNGKAQHVIFINNEFTTLF